MLVQSAMAAGLTCVCGDTMQAACELPEGSNAEGLVVLMLCAMIALGLGRAVGVCAASDDSDDDEPPNGMFT